MKQLTEINITIVSGAGLAVIHPPNHGEGMALPTHLPLEAPMPNVERKPFVEPTLTEEASLAEITLGPSDTSTGGGGPGG